MKIQFVNHASVIITSSDAKILTDPWFFGGAFNDSWSLIPIANQDKIPFDEIDFVYISHEHPDHFHFPTLKSLPDNFKQRVKILFQKNNSEKMVEAFKKLGFGEIILLDNRVNQKITTNTTAEIYQIGSMDTALVIAADNEVIVNINDCEANQVDCKYLKNKYKQIDVVLNQFSMAGYEGFPDYRFYLKRNAQRKIDQLIENHIDLNANVTIPFASNVYFSCEDNKYVNEFSNKPWDAEFALNKRNLKCVLLYPGQEYSVGDFIDNKESIEKYQYLYNNFDFIYNPIESVSLDKLNDSWVLFCKNLHDRYPKWILKKLGVVTVWIKDLKIALSLDVVKSSLILLENNEKRDIELNSQPLYFAFKFAYGIQTLGVSARVIVNRFDNWKWYRLLASLNNAEIYLKPKYFFTRNNISFVINRLLKSGFSQVIYKLKIRGFVNKK
jgi:UDP-MurNAc hydroxylase